MTDDLNGAMKRRRPMTEVLVTLLAAAVLFIELPIGAPASASLSTSTFEPLMIVRVAASNVTYILGNSGCATASCLRLVRTTDALSRYTTMALPPVTSVRGIPSGSLGQVVFATARDGYALNEVNGATTLYVTLDGARSWHRQAITNGAVIGGLVATSTKVYVIAMRCAKMTSGNTGCGHYQLFRSGLLAQQWTSTPIPNGNASPYDYLGRPTAYGDMVFLSEQLHNALLITSRDGGASFDTRLVPRLTSVAGCSLTATSSTALWAECPTGMLVSLFYSGDAGNKWTSLLNPRGPAFAGTGGGAFDPVSSDLAYIDFGQMPRTNNVVRVTNAGRDVKAVGTLKCLDVYSMVFFNRAHGLAVCSDYTHTYFERSVDGGAHWRRFVLP